MRLLVFGGSGFVGTRVLRSAISAGIRVASVSRRGAPAVVDPELSSVEWLKADIEKPAELSAVLKDADAVVSCIGVFGSNDFMRRVNGDANAAVTEAAAAAGAKRYVYISAHTFRPVALALPGYFEGKAIAEEAVSKHFGTNGCVLRPPAIYGTRAVGKYVKLPLGMVGAPLEMLLSTAPMRALAGLLGPVGDLMTPWVSVDAVADAAIAHVMGDDNTPDGPHDSDDGSNERGDAKIMTWEQINQVSSKFAAASPPKVTLFWDGGCPLCSREIAYYKRLDHKNQVDWVDIYSEPDRLKATGVSQAKALSLIHAIDASGRLQVGVPAFVAVWSQLPYWHALATVLQSVPFAIPAVDSAYYAFAKVRLRITGRGSELQLNEKHHV